MRLTRILAAFAPSFSETEISNDADIPIPHGTRKRHLANLPAASQKKLSTSRLSNCLTKPSR